MTTQTPDAPARADADGNPDGTRRDEAVQDLARALVREAESVRELREALVRQRAGVATDSAAAVHGSCDDIARVLVGLEAARRHRVTLLDSLAPGAPATLDALADVLGGTLPEPLAGARATLRREAEGAAREAAVNRAVLRRTVEAGEAFLQALFAGAGEPEPVYRTGERRDDDGAGFLLDRKA